MVRSFFGVELAGNGLVFAFTKGVAGATVPLGVALQMAFDVAMETGVGGDATGGGEFDITLFCGEGGSDVETGGGCMGEVLHKGGDSTLTLSVVSTAEGGDTAQLVCEGGGGGSGVELWFI